MKNIKLAVFCTLTTAITILACSKDMVDQTTTTNDQNSVATKATLQPGNLVTSTCDKFAYSDTIFFPAELPNDYIVKPVNALAGTFGAYPDGLEINPLNGNIDVTESETGLKYIVWFVAKGTRDTCRKFITVSGINYSDSIYVLANNPGIAAPIYNANTLKPADCKGGCEFDDSHDDDDGDGFADEPQSGQEVTPQGIAINKTTGVINLAKSLQNGALGKNPLSGAFKDFILNYRIGDKSSKALNKISFRLYYYKTQSQIPVSLKRELAAKQNQILLEDDNYYAGHGGSSITFTSSLNTTSKNGQGEVKCRPPYIIVTQK